MRTAKSFKVNAQADLQQLVSTLKRNTNRGNNRMRRYLFYISHAVEPPLKPEYIHRGADSITAAISRDDLITREEQGALSTTYEAPSCQCHTPGPRHRYLSARIELKRATIKVGLCSHTLSA